MIPLRISSRNPRGITWVVSMGFTSRTFEGIYTRIPLGNFFEDCSKIFFGITLGIPSRFPL